MKGSRDGAIYGEMAGVRGADTTIPERQVCDPKTIHHRPSSERQRGEEGGTLTTLRPYRRLVQAGTNNAERLNAASVIETIFN